MSGKALQLEKLKLICRSDCKSGKSLKSNLTFADIIALISENSSLSNLIAVYVHGSICIGTAREEEAKYLSI